MTSPRLVLASASPRRRQLLLQIGVAHAVLAQDIDESRRDGETAQAYVARMADEKAAAALAALADPGATVLAADTAVVIGDTVLGKPADQADAVAMLGLLSGRTHSVLTAVTVASAARREHEVSRSEVSFRPISPREAERYWQSGEPRGKAGAYAIQGLGAVFVESLRGSYSGVMGLPLFETAALLERFDIPCWQASEENPLE